ncbi:MAG TPA: hypothetical protein ENI29_08405 [bacterium]|nr:hypothetical protein [bacterium]
MKLLKPLNEYGKKMVEMMMQRAGDRYEEVIESEIELCKRFPDKKIIYISFTSNMGSSSLSRYDENKIMVFGGNPENAAIVLNKLHNYQNYVNFQGKSSRI